MYICKKSNEMALVEINEKSAAGRKELEHLKSQPFAKIIEKKSVKSDAYNRLSQSVKEMKEGKTKPIEQLFEWLYKYRLLVKSKNKGKSGGFRVICFEALIAEHHKKLTLLDLYDKSEKPTVSKKQMFEILKNEGVI